MGFEAFFSSSISGDEPQRYDLVIPRLYVSLLEHRDDG